MYQISCCQKEEFLSNQVQRDSGDCYQYFLWCYIFTWGSEENKAQLIQYPHCNDRTGFKNLENYPANISTVFLRCYLVDTTSRCGATLNQRWNNTAYFNVAIYNVEQHRINVVYFRGDMNNIRQYRNNFIIFNVDFHNVGKHRQNVVKLTISKKNKKKS